MIRTIFLLFIALLIQPSSILAQTEKGIDDKINEAVEPLTAFVESVVFLPCLSLRKLTFPSAYSSSFGALFVPYILAFPTCATLEQALILSVVSTMILMIGEVSHFQALTAALSGTVGLGNIAELAVAIG